MRTPGGSEQCHDLDCDLPSCWRDQRSEYTKPFSELVLTSERAGVTKNIVTWPSRVPLGSACSPPSSVSIFMTTLHPCWPWFQPRRRPFIPSGQRRFPPLCSHFFALDMWMGGFSEGVTFYLAHLCFDTNRRGERYPSPTSVLMPAGGRGTPSTSTHFLFDTAGWSLPAPTPLHFKGEERSPFPSPVSFCILEGGKPSFVCVSKERVVLFPYCHPSAFQRGRKGLPLPLPCVLMISLPPLWEMSILTDHVWLKFQTLLSQMFPSCCQYTCQSCSKRDFEICSCSNDIPQTCKYN